MTGHRIAPCTLVATLGGQPQVVTFTLDLLLARNEPVDQVVIVYLASGRRYQEAHRLLAGEFAGDRYAGRPCHLRSLPIRMPVSAGGDRIQAKEVELADVRTPEEVEAVRAAFFQLLAELKAGGHRLHLSLSGGRRIMALTALAAAMQHLTPADRIWHLYTSPELTEQARGGAVLHAPRETDTRLIEVPFVPWAAYFPGLRPLLDGSGPALRHAWLDETERERCQRVWSHLTPRQRQALRLLASGMTREATARRMGIAVTTVDSHLKVILRKCLLAWDESEVGRLNLSFLREYFGPFLAGMEAV